MKTEYVKVDIVGDLNKDDCCDRFQIMQNRESFDCCFLSCIIYLFSEHVNGFFEVYTLPVIVSNCSNLNLFSSKKKLSERAAHIILLFESFDLVECKFINDGDVYIRSTIGEVGFNDCCKRANKFCKDFQSILSTCLAAFKEWIAYSEKKEKDMKDIKMLESKETRND